jgi:hypothetical protein
MCDYPHFGRVEAVKDDSIEHRDSDESCESIARPDGDRSSQTQGSEKAPATGETPAAEGDKAPATGETPATQGDKAPATGETPATQGDKAPASVQTHGSSKAQDDRDFRNSTPDRLRLHNAFGDEFVFAPLETRTLPHGERWPIDQLLYREVMVKVEPQTERSLEWILVPAFWLVVIEFIAAVNVADAFPDYRVSIWLAAAVAWALIVGGVTVVAAVGGPTVGRQAAQVIMLMLVIVVSIGLPLAAAWRFGVENLWSSSSLAALGRLLQVLFVSLACMIPGLLYFLFDRQRLSTLRDRFEQQIFRLDPNVVTLSDVYARFGRQIEENFGPIGDQAEMRLARQRRWPILFATIALGWILTLLPVGSLGTPQTPTDVANLFIPQPNVVAYGFLGAYFFAINLVLRRYARGDLRPKAYTAITVRVLVVVILGWLVGAIVDQSTPGALVAAFLIGIVPETFLTFLREVYNRQFVARFAEDYESTPPLHHIEGMDIYDRARLLDEGVANIEALAHHDIVDLLLETRIPAARLVDWVDQAILYLHIADPVPGDGRRSGSTTLRSDLRRLGIRTATDLVTVSAQHQNCSAFRNVGTAVSDDSADADNCTLEILLASLNDDEWMKYIENWRRSAVISERIISIGRDGTVLQDERAPISTTSPSAV